MKNYSFQSFFIVFKKYDKIKIECKNKDLYEELNATEIKQLSFILKKKKIKKEFDDLNTAEINSLVNIMMRVENEW
tara:strand:- start:191 stop:418 length:228 start_codon:yes stop_codon:yes gene_type:complete